MEWLIVPVALVFAALIVSVISNAKSQRRDKRAHAAGHGYGGDCGSTAWLYGGHGHSSCCHHDHGLSHGHSGDGHSSDGGGCDSGGSDGGGCGGGDGGGGGGGD